MIHFKTLRVVRSFPRCRVCGKSVSSGLAWVFWETFICEGGKLAGRPGWRIGGWACLPCKDQTPVRRDSDALPPAAKYHQAEVKA